MHLDIDIPIKANQIRRPSEKELSILYRISHLTGVLLDDSVAALGASKEFVRIPNAAQQEVQWARRTLHEYVTRNSDSLVPRPSHSDFYAWCGIKVGRGLGMRL